jgi:hypothetical protein
LTELLKELISCLSNGILWLYQEKVKFRELIMRSEVPSTYVHFHFILVFRHSVPLLLATEVHQLLVSMFVWWFVSSDFDWDLVNEKLQIEIDTGEEFVDYFHVYLGLLVKVDISAAVTAFSHLLFEEFLVQEVICAEQIDVIESANILELCLYKLCLVQLHQFAIMTWYHLGLYIV